MLSNKALEPTSFGGGSAPDPLYGGRMKEFRELFKYGTWANIGLVDHCAQLPPASNEA